MKASKYKFMTAQRHLVVSNLVLATGKYGCREVRVYPTECGEQLKKWELKIPCFKGFVFFWEGTLWDSSLPVVLTLWDTPVLFTPPTSPPLMVVCNFYAEALFCTLFAFCVLLRSFVDLRLRSFALICSLLPHICVFLRPTAFRTTAFGNCRLKEPRSDSKATSGVGPKLTRS